MNKERVLTIDREASRAKLIGDGRPVAPYARSRGFSETTLAQVLSGRFPYQSKPESVFQRVLRTLEKDGYLVEEETAVTHHQAA